MNLDLTRLQSIRTLADDIRRLADALMLRSSAMPEQRIAELMAVLDPAPHDLREVRDDLAALAQEQAAHPATFEPMSVEMTGPIKLELVDGSQLKVRVTAPGQPFREIAIPDGIRSQTELIQHLVNVGAISVLGWKAIDGAKGRTTTINNNAAGAQP